MLCERSLTKFKVCRVNNYTQSKNQNVDRHLNGTSLSLYCDNLFILVYFVVPEVILFIGQIAHLPEPLNISNTSILQDNNV